ncbi:MAG: hypothetical protein H6Q28_1614, partial [Bacteroidetes bacterium]|nr:hypothetical protein [Bacteroidota bacterium]
MRISGRIILVALTAAVLAGCGGGKQSLQSVSECDIPEWYSKAPQDPNYLFAARTATSQDMQIALDKATTDGRAEV